MTITIKALAADERGSCPEELSFGAVFSDHMFTQEYNKGTGWQNAEIAPFHNIVLNPAAPVLHYGQEIFEGLKAYRRADGGVNLFRPEENFKRFNRSAERMSMPAVDEDFHLDVLKQWVSIDQSWVPSVAESSFYIRPAMIATGAKLGLSAADSYLHFIIGGPVGPYFSEGFNPVSVYVSDTCRRAVVGGIGEAKTGGNYAASLHLSEEVAKQGYTQVLWLDAIEGRYVEEVGAMNIFFVYEGKTLVTPELSGSILAGITRDSVLKLAPTLGFDVSEERLDINQVLADIESGKITEVFGCGTAAVISPVGKLCLKGKEYIVNDFESGPVSKSLYDELTGIQYGTREDKFGWVVSL